MSMRTCAWIIAGLMVATPLWADDLLDGLADPTRPSFRGAATAGVSRGVVQAIASGRRAVQPNLLQQRR